jgi:Wzt-like putative exopolysaccharide export protein
VVDLVAAVAINRDDGLQVAAAQSGHADCVLSGEPGPGRVQLEIDNLTLGPGRYWVTVAFQNPDATQVYDALYQAAVFEVARTPNRTTGLAAMTCRWVVSQSSR